MIDTSTGFTLVREFAATPEEIWRAWTDADAASHWWHPTGMSTPSDTVEIDARVGFGYTYTMVRDDSGERYVTGGIYREVVPFERLAFTWGSPDDAPDDAPVVTITLEPIATGTRQVFDLRGVGGEPGDDSYYDGWMQALDALDDYLV